VVAGLRLQTVFVMEGGYCLEKIGPCVRGVMDGFVQDRAKGSQPP